MIKRQKYQTGELPSVDWSRFDFIDIGCSRGNSLRYCMRRFGAAHGAGVDLNPDRVQMVRDAGFAAFHGDARALSAERAVRFVSMMDFLEHLPSLKHVQAVIESAGRAATDFLWIFHPSFEGEEYLRAIGYKQAWWDWRVHTAHIQIADYLQILDRLGLRQIFIRPVKPVADTSHPSVLPIDAPPNQKAYDAALHGPKEHVEFPKPLWRAQEIFVALRPLEDDEWRRITAPNRAVPADTPL
jgi:hypothetical protein